MDSFKLAVSLLGSIIPGFLEGMLEIELFYSWLFSAETMQQKFWHFVCFGDEIYLEVSLSSCLGNGHHMFQRNFWNILMIWVRGREGKE